jgi:hypothetical protein
MHDKKVEPVLTDYDITINSIHRENMFKGTITVCIVYAIFAFILIAAAYFSDNIRDLLFDRFLPFTLIYIIGTIIIILIFIYYIVSFVPKKIDKNKLDDSISCPDFWKLEILDDNVIENSFDTTNYNKKLFKYRCVMDDKVFNKGAIYKQDKNTTIPELQYKLGNKPAIVTPNSKDGANIYNDTYNSADAGSLSLFLKEENDKHYHLYKDINKYKNKNLIYTNNNITSTNIQKDLIDAALIMNNYEKKSTSDTLSYYYQDKLSIATPAPISSSANPTLPSTGLKNYLNSPNNLTWASKLSTTGNDAAIVRGASADATYFSVVYDWSTFDPIKYKDTHGKTTTYVYALDETIPSGTNIAKIGTIEYESEDGTYIFKTLAAGIAIPSTLFVSNIETQKNYYLDKTIISADSGLNSNQNPNTANLIFGPKVRLYNNTERPIQIPKTSALNDQIPLTCSAVYPSFLASKEDSYSENNTLRCAYSEICKIPWSDLHCNKINIQ